MVFRDQIRIPGEISCPGMVSDPQNLDFLLRLEISLWINFFTINITLIQTLAVQPFDCLGFVETSRFACAYLQCIPSKAVATLRWLNVIWHEFFAIEECKTSICVQSIFEAKSPLAHKQLLYEVPSLRVTCGPRSRQFTRGSELFYS